MQYAIPITERISQPTPEEIRIARNNAELTQAEAAQLISAAQIKPYRNWQSYEVPKGQSRVMPLVSWELFLVVNSFNNQWL